MVGVAWGAYSSVCITGALWYVMKMKIGAKAQPAKQTGDKKEEKIIRFRYKNISSHDHRSYGCGCFLTAI